MHERLGPWPFRGVWIVVPLLTGPLLADGLHDTATPWRTIVSTALWVAWGVVLTASLVPRTWTLTLVRTTVPVVVPLAVWAAFGDGSATAAIVGLSAAALVTVIVFDPVMGERFVDGSSYGPEYRTPLRPPAAVYLGPLPLSWIVAVAGATLGPLLLAAQRWGWGATATVVGAPLAAAAVRSLHGLSLRWLVFVPAGLVIHDPLTLRDPVLAPRDSINAVGPARTETDQDRLDLTGRAPGLAVEIDFRHAIGFGLVRGRAETTVVDADAVLVTPSRPARVMIAAADRLGLG